MPAKRPSRSRPANAPAETPAEPQNDAKRASSYALLAPDVKRHYLGYFKMVFNDGALDLKTKELIAFGAALMTGAPNVLAGHLKKLRRLGVTEAQIAEATAVALGVAGASVVDRGDVAEAMLRAETKAKEQQT
ncbi:MAG: carboxymuconolactone decarboxylase family protein [Planctomycetes bacterium]|nr:carboxymuconolactone decarboxylase family protein [Planctomycetota bacterium]